MTEDQNLSGLERRLSTLATSEVPPWLVDSVIDRVRADAPNDRPLHLFRAGTALIAGLAAVILIVFIALPAVLPASTPAASSAFVSQGSSSPSLPHSVAATRSPFASPNETSPQSDPSPRASERPSLPPLSRQIDLTVQTITGPLSPRFNASAVWTGTELIIWGGGEAQLSDSSRKFNDGAAYNPATGEWRIIADPPIGPRYYQLASWTGRDMLIWGGDRSGNGLSDGAAYDPATDSWRMIADSPVPWTTGAAGVWTGAEWVVGRTGRKGGVELLEFMAYEVASDTWRDMPDIEAPTESETSLAWSGDELFARNSTSGIYRLPADAAEWVLVAQIPNMPAVGNIVWNGQRLMTLVVQFGNQGPVGVTLSEWDPETNDWRLIPDPAGDLTEPQILLAEGGVLLLRSDLIYDVANEQWSTADFPDEVERLGEVQVWMDDRLAIWGGGSGDPATAISAGLVITPLW